MLFSLLAGLIYITNMFFDLDHLSRIGFGCYRITSHHYAALHYALANGVNLVDTANSYTKGDSEHTVGRVLRDYPDIDCFVISKAGYASPEEIDQLIKQGLPKSSVVTYGMGYRHCIHPQYLDYCLNLTLSRMQAKSVGAYLLHNPEYYFNDDASTSSEEFYHRIKRAFEFFEEKVAEGIIQYYGISSNTFPDSIEEAKTLNLETVLDIASNVSPNHSFKIIQFPFNYYERGASLPQYDGDSLLELAKKNNIKTISNRPYNAHISEGTVRLVSYSNQESQINYQDAEYVFGEIEREITARLLEMGREEKFEEFGILRYLKMNWQNFQVLAQYEQAFQNGFFPFLDTLYDGRVPAVLKKLSDLLSDTSRAYTIRNITDRISSIKANLEDSVKNGKNFSVSDLLCRSYLRSGIDHVLIGMRSSAYFDDVRSVLT